MGVCSALVLSASSSIHIELQTKSTILFIPVANEEFFQFIIEFPHSVASYGSNKYIHT